MRIFIPPIDLQKEIPIQLSADKSHYLISVLRGRQGDVVTVIDGKGKAYSAEITTVSNTKAFVKIVSEIAIDTEAPFDLVLCQGILKGEKMDMVIQKTTELGIKEIIPVITERSIVRQTRKIDRWRKIAEEAAEQCGRAVVPVIHEPMEYSKALSAFPVHHGFIFWEEGGMTLTDAVLKISSHPIDLLTDSTIHQSVDSSIHPFTHSPIHLFIGPEGGFTSEEISQAEDKGLARTTLGKRILRAETAAIAAVTLVQFLFDK